MKAEWTNSDSLTTSQTTKALLVIDKPKDCFTCELGGSKVCIGGCPLRPIPESKEHNDDVDYDYGFIDGWNACLDEITGETE